MKTTAKPIATGPITAVRTTGIFCRPGCPARPRPANTERFRWRAQALLAGYRACRRCHPLGADEAAGFDASFQEYAAATTPSAPAPAVHVSRIDTPLGVMIAAATREHVVLLEFAGRRMMRTQFRRIRKALGCRFAPGESPVLVHLRRELSEYFEGRRRQFGVPLHVPGTGFQAQVWAELRRIPSGATRSYGRMAAEIGRPAAVRAVAKANGDNRVAILIPCHRVIGADGRMVGYGGGVWRKRALLALEADGHLPVGQATGRSSGRLARRPSPDERPRRRRMTQGRR